MTQTADHKKASKGMAFIGQSCADIVYDACNEEAIDGIAFHGMLLIAAVKDGYLVGSTMFYNSAAPPPAIAKLLRLTADGIEGKDAEGVIVRTADLP
jgi:hypothetical protein